MGQENPISILNSASKTFNTNINNQTLVHILKQNWTKEVQKSNFKEIQIPLKVLL